VPVELAVAAMRRKRVNLIVWAAITASLVAIIVAFYPSIKGDASLDKTFADFPESVRALFGTNSLISPVGYLTGRLFALFLPGTLIGFTIGRGAAAVAGEEEQHTLNLTLAYPVTRGSVVLQRLAAMLAELLALTAVAWLALVALSGPSGFDIGLRYETAAIIETAVLAATFGVGALAIGAWTGKRSLATGISSGVAVAGYLIDSLSKVVEALRPLRPFTVWRWYDGHQPLTDGIDPVGMSVLIVLAVVFIVIGTITFERRDVRE
jgi:ABC-2 type transport system permease protein